MDIKPNNTIYVNNLNTKIKMDGIATIFWLLLRQFYI